MTFCDLRIHPGLQAGSRFWRAGTATLPTVADWLVLMSMGVSAAAMRGLLDLHLGIPGHSILLVVLPYALGLGAVQRRGAGVVMSATAATTFLSMQRFGMGGAGVGPGALTSLIALGPLLDLALTIAKGGWWRIYSATIAAAVATNAVAFAIRAAAKLSGVRFGHHAWTQWFPYALMTYTLCAIAAGLISAAIAFRFQDRRNDP